MRQELGRMLRYMHARELPSAATALYNGNYDNYVDPVPREHIILINAWQGLFENWRRVCGGVTMDERGTKLLDLASDDDTIL
ncbi:hypothetical protein FZEAL_1264 [Fusarium zealandicum]|uniref:Uncharacterized protein n=1 Tax=Fusarium zealandicum TaxID=1053134 RepID=A0A8H4UT98_9HYPO|nr:hypothetical protein FZEAL_1264 [Fusarium zealandicum]